MIGNAGRTCRQFVGERLGAFQKIRAEVMGCVNQAALLIVVDCRLGRGLSWAFDGVGLSAVNLDLLEFRFWRVGRREYMGYYALPA